MNEELKRDVEKLVSEIFSQKEEAEQRAETEKALNKSAEAIVQLTEDLEAKNTELSEMAGTVETFESKIDELTSELEAAKKETEETAGKLTEAENTIEEMKKDKAAEVRMAELVDTGIALSDKAAQVAKIRDMSDEDFTSYKNELAALRAAVEAELAKKSKDTEPVVADGSAADTATVTDGDVDVDVDTDTATVDDGDDDLAPANVDPDVTATAAMNLEVNYSNDDFLSKYAALGKALAEKIKNER
jgi:hypothetical protein